MVKWKCSICGYERSSDAAPGQCPVCGAPQADFHHKEAPAPTPSAEPLNQEAQKQWKCLVCGYIHTGPEPPDICPVCGADKSKFILVADEPATRDAKPPPSIPARNETTEQAAQIDTRQRDSRVPPFAVKLLAPMEFISRLHGHPIAVHIPNGVLPLSLIFTLFAVLLKSDAFATAAAYNIVFVSLSMPVVILSGFIDWYHRFDARWARIFNIKVVCALIVGTLSLIIAWVWFSQPTIHQKLSLRLIFFLVLNIVNVITAAVAGYYGGKLVFRK
jgi:rubredoxin/uncharacterized membrane protein